MKVSMEWLSEYVELDMDAAYVADLLSMSGTEVERVAAVGSGVEGVVAGRVIRVDDHPNADNLRLAMVEDGSVVRQVVCGAPNLRAGMKSALALPGAKLPLVSDAPLKQAEIRGVSSDGMLCSGAELGVTDDASTIIELDSDAEVGMDVGLLLPVEDVVLELEITPNRPDCMSMIGVARELAALLGLDLRRPQVEMVSSGPKAGELAGVEVKDLVNCPRYSAALVTDVGVRPSPAWMQRRLIASGLRPINNIVDATNYVLVETGQPLHAFDLEKLSDRKIIVRLARYGEVLTTLDGVQRQLDERALVIADTSGPVALAGIMGGLDSEVSDSTKSVLIESAHFAPTSIQLTSKRLGLRTEASGRFERGTDPGGTVYAARRAAMLMLETAGGRVAPGVVDVYPEPVAEARLRLRPERTRTLLGVDIPPERILEILEGLRMDVSGSDPISVQVPTFRRDVEREIDLIEEIARVYGYDRIPESIPGGAGPEAGMSLKQRLASRIDELLVGQGLAESVNYSLIEESDLTALGIVPGERLSRAVRIVNPISGVGDTLRTTLAPGLIKTASLNVSRGNHDLRLFERGRVFIEREPGELPLEVEAAGILLTGARGRRLWEGDGSVDFFDLKGVVENLGTAFDAELYFEKGERSFLSAGSTAEVLLAGKSIGYVGRISDSVCESFELEGDFYLAEIEVEPLIESAEPDKTYSPVGRFPPVKVDIAVVVDLAIPAADVRKRIVELGGEYLIAVELFDVYEGPQVPEGRRSMAFALVFGSAEGTLTDEEAHSRLERIVTGLESDLGAALRGREKEGRT